MPQKFLQQFHGRPKRKHLFHHFTINILWFNNNCTHFAIFDSTFFQVFSSWMESCQSSHPTFSSMQHLPYTIAQTNITFRIKLSGPQRRWYQCKKLKSHHSDLNFHDTSLKTILVSLKSSKRKIHLQDVFSIPPKTSFTQDLNWNTIRLLSGYFSH